MKHELFRILWRPQWVALRLVLGAAALASVAHGGDASAAEVRAEQSTDAAANKLNDEGLALYQQRDFRRAIEKFEDAFRISRDATTVYNIARCHEELNEFDGAIRNYDAAAAHPAADAVLKRKAHERAQTLRAMSERAAQQAASASSKSSAPAKESELQPSVSSSTSPWTWVTLAAGGAFAVGGTVLYMLGDKDHKEITGDPAYKQVGRTSDMTEKQARELIDSGDTKKTLGVVGWSVGAASLTTAAILYLTGGRRSKEQPPSVGVAAIPTDRGGFVSFQGSF